MVTDKNIIIIITIIIIVIVIISFMQGIYTYIPETDYVPREYSVAAILLLLFVVLISLVPVLNLLYYFTIITGITFVFTFHMRCISIVRSLYFRIFSASFLISFLSPEIATSINIHVPFSLSRVIMPGLLLGIVLTVCTCWFHNVVTFPPWLVSIIIIIIYCKWVFTRWQ